MRNLPSAARQGNIGALCGTVWVDIILQQPLPFAHTVGEMLRKTPCCAAEDGSYISTGSTAELFEGTFKKGRHYVSASGIPVWEVYDNSGAVKGSVKGRAVTKVARKPEASDGGFGSVDSVLYVIYDADGEQMLMTSHRLLQNLQVHCRQCRAEHLQGIVLCTCATFGAADSSAMVKSYSDHQRPSAGLKHPLRTAAKSHNCPEQVLVCAGWLADVTYIELQSPLGGVVPRGMHALPAHENVVDNHKLAIPYQAEYVLLTGGLPYGPIGEGGKERLEFFERHLHHPMTEDSLRLRKAMSAHEHSRP